MLRFRVLGASLSRFGCFVFETWVLRFRVLGAPFLRFGCFVFETTASKMLNVREKKAWGILTRG